MTVGSKFLQAVAAYAPHLRELELGDSGWPAGLPQGVAKRAVLQHLTRLALGDAQWVEAPEDEPPETPLTLSRMAPSLERLLLGDCSRGFDPARHPLRGGHPKVRSVLLADSNQWTPGRANGHGLNGWLAALTGSTSGGGGSAPGAELQAAAALLAVANGHGRSAPGVELGKLHLRIGDAHQFRPAHVEPALRGFRPPAKPSPEDISRFNAARPSLIAALPGYALMAEQIYLEVGGIGLADVLATLASATPLRHHVRQLTVRCCLGDRLCGLWQPLAALDALESLVFEWVAPAQHSRIFGCQWPLYASNGAILALGGTFLLARDLWPSSLHTVTVRVPKEALKTGAVRWGVCEDVHTRCRLAVEFV